MIKSTKKQCIPYPHHPIPNLQHYHFPTVSSTAYLANLVVQNNPTLQSLPNLFQRCFAVSAAKQSEVISFKGRTWESPPGNCYLTFVVPCDLILFQKKLIPLKLSSIIAKSMIKHLPEKNITTKWPNDILINGKKIGVIFVKEVKNYILLTINVNVKQAPYLRQEQAATCVFEFSKSQSDGCKESKRLAKGISQDIFNYLADIQSSKRDIIEQEILEEWKSMTQFGNEYKIWNKENIIDTKEKNFLTLGIEKDGNLKVKNEEGKEESLESFIFID